MSEFTDGIEMMREAALDRIAEAESLEEAAYMIKGTKFFFTPDEDLDSKQLRAVVHELNEEDTSDDN